MYKELSSGDTQAENYRNRKSSSLGFCVGFSLHDLSYFALEGIEFYSNKMKNNKRSGESKSLKQQTSTLHDPNISYEDIERQCCVFPMVRCWRFFDHRYF